MQKKFKIIFSLIGIYSFFRIIQGYGLTLIRDEIRHSGIYLIFIMLTFVPTLFCYALSWLLATNHQQMKNNFSFIQKIKLFTKFTVVSIAWNNLTPFLKIGGEPLKYLMLSQYLTKKDAINSTVNYNIIHLLSTVLSFVIAAIILNLFYIVPQVVTYYSVGFIVLCFSLVYFVYKIVLADHTYITNLFHWRFLRFIFINSKIVMNRLTHLYKRDPKIFFLSLFFDTLARFIEGMTFYFGFLLIKHPVSVVTASFLDIARTFVDTLFFFIPYQVGSREEGVRFFMQNVLSIDPSGFLTAVLIYRLVEIFWIFIGYSVWVSMGRSSSVEIV
jgi:hypothetical protein